MPEPDVENLDLAKVLEQFGRPFAEFHSSSTNLIAGIIIGVLAVLGGILFFLLPLFEEAEPWHIWRGRIFGTTLLAVGSSLIFWCMRKFS